MPSLFLASRRLLVLIKSRMQYFSHCSQPTRDSLLSLQVCITLLRIRAIGGIIKCGIVFLTANYMFCFLYCGTLLMSVGTVTLSDIVRCP